MVSKAQRMRTKFSNLAVVEVVAAAEVVIDLALIDPRLSVVAAKVANLSSMTTTSQLYES